jgi:hypothetical protein
MNLNYNIPGYNQLKKEEKKIAIQNYKFYEENRKEHVDFVKEYENSRKAIIDAEPKVGKKVLVIVEVLRKNKNIDYPPNFIMLTGLDRLDNRVQHEELKLYGIETYLTRQAKQFLKHIEKLHYTSNGEIYIFLDESDYGTEDKQILNKIFLDLCELVNFLESKKHKKTIYIRYFSGSNEEINCSKYGKKCDYFEFETPEFYRGAAWHLENNLVHEAEPFFIYDENKIIVPSKQGMDLLESFRNQEKPFSILRIANKNKSLPTFNSVKECSQLRSWLLNELGISLILIDQHHPLDWGAENISSTNHWSNYYGGSKKIFLINQTCSRSTELGFIPLIYFWHDHRSSETPYSTIIQSALRVSHYPYEKNEKYWPDPQTGSHIYTSVNCIRYRARKGPHSISLEELISRENRPISTRITSGNRSNFVPTEEMISARTIEFISVPEEVSNNIDKNKIKQRYPELNQWASKQENIKKHREQYSSITKDKTKQFIRTISGQNKANLAKDLAHKNSHGVLAPIFIDGPNKNYLDDYENLLKKYLNCQGKIALIWASKEEMIARKNFKESKPKSKNSMYDDQNNLLNKDFDDEDYDSSEY